MRRARPLTPAPPLMTDGERRAQRRHTWKLLLVGVVTNFVGCGVHYMFIEPPRLAGAMPAPRLPPTELREQTPAADLTLDVDSQKPGKP